MPRNTPAQIGTETDWALPVGGRYYTIAIKTGGSLWGWGWNWAGQVGDGTTTDRLVPVTVEGLFNQSPVAANDFASTTRNTAVYIPLTANDYDVDGTISPTVTVWAPPNPGGTLQVIPGGVIYNPARNFKGMVTFSYSSIDNFGAFSNVATVTVNVTR